MAKTVEQFGRDRGFIPYQGSTSQDFTPNADSLCLPFNIVPITGAFLDETAYQPYAKVIRDKYRQNVHIVQLDYARSDKKLDDYAEELIEAIDGLDNVVFNPHSRPYDVTARALNILESRGEITRIHGVVAMNTGGSHLVWPDNPALAHMSRHTDEFKAEPDPTDENREILAPDVARRIFGRFITDKDFLEDIVTNSHPQPKPNLDREVWRGIPDGVPFRVVQGALDPAINMPRARAVLYKTHGQAPYEVPDAGHMLPAEQPERAACLIVKHAVFLQIK